jgi:EmrB/QacA subfamily drug resistance transporter
VDLVAWAVLSYAIAVISFLMVFGALSEKKGYCLSYKYGFSIFIISSVLCGLAYNIYFLIFSRAVQGIGAALLIAVGPALLTRSFPPNERGRGLSVIAMVVSVGLMLGPPLGGFIVAAGGWRWIFFVNVPFGLIGIYFTEKYIRDFPIANPRRKIGLPGAFSLSAALLLFMITLSLYSRQVLGFHYLAGLLLLSSIFFFLFLYFEGDPETRLIGLDIFRNRVFTFSGLSMMLVFISLSSVTVLMPFYLEQVKRFEPKDVGLILMIVPVCGFVMAPVAGYLADRIQARIISTIGIIIMAGGIYIVEHLSADSGLYIIITALFVIGVGMGIFSTPNTSSIMGAAKQNQLGAASGILATIRSLGLAFGVSLAIAIFNYYQSLSLRGGSDETAAFISGYRAVYKFIAIATLPAIIFSFVRGKNLARTTTRT